MAQSSAASAQLTWADNATDETGYRLERKVNDSGTYSTLATLGAGATGHTDPGPFTNGNVYYYRVIATGPGGDSLASNEGSFDATAGFFEFNETFTKVSKNVGTALIAVKRFGGVNGPVSVSVATSNSTAIAGTHYITTTNTLNWADGETGETGEKTANVPIAATPTAQQPRQFRITLTSPSSGTGIGTYNAISVLIEDPTAPLPDPWNQAIIGTVTGSSPAVQAESSFSSATIGGTGLGGAVGSEAGQFIYQTRTGDGVMTALVPAASPAQSGARYFVMIRENSTNASALMAGTVTTSSSTVGAKLLYRITTGGSSVLTGNALTAITPQWLRITRAGSSFTSECSADGNHWTTLGSAAVSMASSAQWGLFHHSDDWSTTNYSANFQTANFQNVTFGAVSVPGAPAGFAFSQPTPSRVALTWTAAASAAGYRVERRTENGNFAQIIDLDGAALDFTDDPVAADTAYEYRVFAVNSSGNGPATPTLRVTAPPGGCL